jgi:hypothetical protein
MSRTRLCGPSLVAGLLAAVTAVAWVLPVGASGFPPGRRASAPGSGSLTGRRRLFLVRKRSSLKHRVHAQLLAFGHACPVSDLFGRRGRELLGRLQFPEPWPGLEIPEADPPSWATGIPPSRFRNGGDRSNQGLASPIEDGRVSALLFAGLPLSDCGRTKKKSASPASQF